MMHSTDRDDLAALDFSADHGADPGDDADALDFSYVDERGDESVADVLDHYAQTDPAAAEARVDELAEDTDGDGAEEDVLGPFTVTVTNPPETVSVSALVDGSVREIELSPRLTGMSESQLADEIVVLADLARQKGLAGQHTFLMENPFLSEMVGQMGPDGRDMLRDFVETGMALPTPEQASAAQAQVFATRYGDGED